MSNGHLGHHHRCTEAPTDHNYNEPTENTQGVIPVHHAANTKLLANQDASDAIFVVVMGVSGTGKSTLGVALSEALHLPFVDGDDLHPQSNVAKMSRGEPLTDADRQPWLETIRKTALAHVLSQRGIDREPRVGPGTISEIERARDMVERGCEPGPMGEEDKKFGIIVACSSLKRAYRSVLRGEDLPEGDPPEPSLRTYFVYMKGSREVLMDRMTQRQGHFMKAAMLDSQLNTLESPESEKGVVTVSVGWSTESQVRHVVKALGLEGAGEGWV